MKGFSAQQPKELIEFAGGYQVRTNIESFVKETDDGPETQWSYDYINVAMPEAANDKARDIALLEVIIQDMHDNKAKELGYDNINSIGKYIGYDNAFRLECESLGTWAAACWAKCYELLNSPVELTISDVLDSLPGFV